MKSISLFSGYIYLILAIITGIASNGFLKTTEGFTRLNTELRRRGFIVEEVPYAEIAKMEGLFRCSTMPLIRE